MNRGSGGLQHRQAHQSVIQQNGVAGFHILGKLSIGDGTAGFVTRDILGGEGEILAGFEHHGAVAERPQPDLGALGVQHGGYRQIQFLPQGLELIQTLFMLFVTAMGKVEAGHIHSRQEHFPQHALPVGGGAKCADDLGFSHESIPPFLQIENRFTNRSLPQNTHSKK